MKMASVIVLMVRAQSQTMLYSIWGAERLLRFLSLKTICFFCLKEAQSLMSAREITKSNRIPQALGFDVVGHPFWSLSCKRGATWELLIDIIIFVELRSIVFACLLFIKDKSSGTFCRVWILCCLNLGRPHLDDEFFLFEPVNKLFISYMSF